MNISGLKIDTAEYKAEKGFTDIILRSPTANVRLYIKDNGENLDLLLNDKEYTFTLQESVATNKWGTDALHYVWGLINQIGNLLQTSKEEVYLTCLKRYSQSDILVCTLDDWKIKQKEYKYHEILDEREFEGTPLIVVKWWKGIHSMTSHELNIFIEGVKSECKELNIDTSTPSELALLGGSA